MVRFLRLSTLVGVAALAACPAPKPADTGPKVIEPQGPQPKDEAHTYEAVALPGTYFVPEGLDRPGMLLVRPTKKMTLAKQRTAFAKAKPEMKVAEAEILATMLYEEAQKQADAAARTALLEEARKALSDARVAGGATVDVVLLHNLAALAYDLGDVPAATEALIAAVALAPDDAGTADRRAYVAYYHLVAGRDAEAAAAVEGLTPAADRPEQSYALAWVAWRKGDLAGARAAMTAAVQGWRLRHTLPAIKRDALIFGARTGASVDEAQAIAAAFAEHIKDAAHLKGIGNATLETLVYMHQAFKLSGRYAESIGLVDRMFQVKPNLNKVDAPKLYLEQADAAKRLGRSRELVAYATKGIEALKACGADCIAKDHEEAARAVFGQARFANYLYTTSQDEAWFEAATALYALYLSIPGITDAAAVQGEAQTLEGNHAKAKKNAGTHDKGALGFILDDHAAQVLACYDRQLQREPTLSGTLTLQLEIAATGEVTGATTEPAAGEAGVAGVAACAIDTARAWAFPARTMPGVTRVTVPYTLQPPAPPAR